MYLPQVAGKAEQLQNSLLFQINITGTATYSCFSGNLLSVMESKAVWSVSPDVSTLLEMAKVESLLLATTV